MRHTLIAALLALPATAGAVTVRDCDTELANARHLARPFDTAARSYADGEVGVVSLLREEPAGLGAALMVLFPDNESGLGLCRMIVTEDGMGWASTDLAAAEARYDAATGLHLSIPITRYDGTDFASETLLVTLDRAAQRVTATTRD